VVTVIPARSSIARFSSGDMEATRAATLAHFVVLSVANRVQLPLSYIMQLSPQVICAGKGQRWPLCALPGVQWSFSKNAQFSLHFGYIPPENGQSLRGFGGSSGGAGACTIVDGAYSMQYCPTRRKRWPRSLISGYSVSMLILPIPLSWHLQKWCLQYSPLRTRGHDSP